MNQHPDPGTITHIVAIDGPAGAGKSTTARQVAERLGFAFMDTGAMYRAATWNALHQGIDLDEPEAVAGATDAMDLRIDEHNGLQQVFVNDHDVTEAIRTPEVTRMIYKLDQAPAVRERLVALQRAFGARQPTVAEGRDIGTVVFPKALCKIYMDANPEERARRRVEEMHRKGVEADAATVLREILERDEKDQTRNHSPLRCAEDAHVLDTTVMSPDEAVDAIVRLARAAF